MLTCIRVLSLKIVHCQAASVKLRISQFRDYPKKRIWHRQNIYRQKVTHVSHSTDNLIFQKNIPNNTWTVICFVHLDQDLEKTGIMIICCRVLYTEILLQTFARMFWLRAYSTVNSSGLECIVMLSVKTKSRAELDKVGVTGW